MIRSFVFWAVFLALSPCGYAKTAATLTTEARILSRDPYATGRARFTDAQILESLNEGQRDAIAATLCIQKTYTFDTSSASQYYSQPSDFIQIARVLSDEQRLEEKSPAKLDQASSEWENVTGYPQNYFISFASRTKIGIYPYPISNSSTETVKIEYYAQPIEMVSTSTPFNSIVEFIPFQQMLPYYAAAQMGYIDGLIAQADRYFQRYAIYRQQFNDYCRARPGYFPNVSVAPVK